MLGAALYYPFIDVRDQAWLRSAILFWDKIQTIVPTTITKPYRSRDTLICQEEGYLEPFYCELHPEILEKLGKRVMSLFNQPGWVSGLLEQAQSDPSMRAIRRSDKFRSQIDEDFNLVGIYPEKMSPEMRNALVEIGIGRIDDASRKKSTDLKKLFGFREEYEGDWILVNSNFAAIYMAALAAALAREVQLSPLTNRESYQGLNLRFLIDDDAKLGAEDANGALLTLVMESLRVDPATSVRKLIAFRRKRALQLAELSGMFDDFRAKIENSESQRELRNSAKRIFENKIRPGLEKLKRELQDQAILSSWEGFYQAATFSVAAGAAVTAFAQSNSLNAVSAGLFLTGTTVAVKSIFANRKARASSPYTYLLDIERRFSLPRYS